MTTLAIPSERSVEPVFRPIFRADWRDVLFVHYSIDPDVLGPHVPFELDLFDGRAWVSLVAFTQARFRPAFGGRLGEWLMRPVATHGFLNLRTYVRGGEASGERAIYFISEWIPNRLTHFVGPRLYGLPLRLARLEYGDDERKVVSAQGAVDLNVRSRGAAIDGRLSDFLLERYTAFTAKGGRGRMFRIRHEPWRYRDVAVEVVDDSLIRRVHPWFAAAELVGAHLSVGVFDVEIGGARSVECSGPDRECCKTRPRSGPAKRGWLIGAPVILLAAIVVISARRWPAWGLMWTLALAIYAGCKWATWWEARGVARRAELWRSIGYLLAWPGMDAWAFLAAPPAASRERIVLRATARMLMGTLLLAVIARRLDGGLLAGWAGMVGMILLLHFGLFDLLAAAWQRTGVRAERIMRSPLAARSLGEFWGGRWNRAFRDLAYAWIFTPLHRRVGAAWATLAVFAASGVVHELLISFPARAGYGLPALYFLLQWLGVSIEKSRWGKCVLRGVAGRIFAIAVAALPLPILFHPPFVLGVIVPFLHAIRAI
jgi:alginate O-acetyltransferase complex protein AlgI